MGRHHGAHRAGRRLGRGRRRTKAFLQDDGTWHIEGVKRFITSAEHDMSDNIVHLVLARPEGVEGAGGPGTKGLSLFVVPKYLFDIETGEIGERNGAYVTNVEKKMGLKASPPPASSPSATRSRRSATSSATCTRASRRCSRSSSTPA